MQVNFKPRVIIRWIFALCFLALCPANAENSETGFTFDLGQISQKQELPSWITGQPSASPAAHATISFPITPPPGDHDFAVTFYFKETQGGFLKVYWEGVKNSEMLSDNLYEGIAMPNQRTVLIKHATLSSAGKLVIQSSETTLNIMRIHFEWVTPTTVALADAAKQSAMVNAAGKVLTTGEVDGSPTIEKPDEIGKNIVVASLIDKPERIESGVEFVASLQAIPQHGRLEVWMAGVPIDKAVQLWVNGACAGTIAMELPDLSDPGYQSVVATPPVYIGWRKGVIYLQAERFKAGDNRFQFTIQGASSVTPVAVKGLILQLKYDMKMTGAGNTTQASGPSAN